MLKEVSKEPELHILNNNIARWREGNEDSQGDKKDGKSKNKKGAEEDDVPVWKPAFIMDRIPSDKQRLQKNAERAGELNPMDVGPLDR